MISEQPPPYLNDTTEGNTAASIASVSLYIIDLIHRSLSKIQTSSFSSFFYSDPAVASSTTTRIIPDSSSAGLLSIKMVKRTTRLLETMITQNTTNTTNTTTTTTTSPSSMALEPFPLRGTINEFLPRIAGSITVVCALCMLVMASQRSDRVFHRLVLGMSIHLVIQGTFRMYGTAAIPAEFADVPMEYAPGASGTIRTCTVQGFFEFLCINTALFYYASFALYSCVAMAHNFNPAQYGYIEKYLHLGVHLYPVGAALAVLLAEGYNNTGYGFCSIASSPLNCGEHEVVTDDAGDSTGTATAGCLRGPTTTQALHRYHTLDLLSNILVLVVPTVVMMVVTGQVRHRERHYHRTNRPHSSSSSSTTVVVELPPCIAARTVFLQSWIYLGPLYVTILPFLIESIIEYGTDRQIQYDFLMAGLMLFSLFSVFTLFMYIYFTVPTFYSRLLSCGRRRDTPHNPTITTTNNTSTTTRNNKTTTTKNQAFPGTSPNTTNTPATDADPHTPDTTTTSSSDCTSGMRPVHVRTDTTTKSNSTRAVKMNMIFGTLSTPNVLASSGRQAAAESPVTTAVPPSAGHATRRPSSVTTRYSFNIFDGTNANGAYAEFIHEGDSEDLQRDDHETAKWNACQNHI